MELNDIKKALYKQGPIAKFMVANKDGLQYACIIQDFSKPIVESQQVSFCIPFSDIGDAKFVDVMEAKLLNRWITT